MTVPSILIFTALCILSSFWRVTSRDPCLIALADVPAPKALCIVTTSQNSGSGLFCSRTPER